MHTSLDFTPFESTVLIALAAVFVLLVLFALGVCLGYVVRRCRGAGDDELPAPMRRQIPDHYRKEWDEERNCWRAVPVFRAPPLSVDESATHQERVCIGGEGCPSPGRRGGLTGTRAGDPSRSNTAATTGTSGAIFNQ